MEMTPEAALQILDQIASQVSLNRAQHVTVGKAVEVLAAFIQEHTPEGDG